MAYATSYTIYYPHLLNPLIFTFRSLIVRSANLLLSPKTTMPRSHICAISAQDKPPSRDSTPPLSDDHLLYACRPSDPPTSPLSLTLRTERDGQEADEKRTRSGREMPELRRFDADLAQTIEGEKPRRACSGEPCEEDNKRLGLLKRG